MGFKLVAQIQQVSSDWVAVHWSWLGKGPKMRYETHPGMADVGSV